MHHAQSTEMSWSINEMDNGRPFDVRTYANRVKQSIEAGAFGVVSTADRRTLVSSPPQLGSLPSARGGHPTQLSSPGTLISVQSDVSVNTEGTNRANKRETVLAESLTTPSIVRAAIRAGKVPDFAELGRSYHQYHRYHGLPPLAAPSALMRADLLEWRQRQLEAESVSNTTNSVRAAHRQAKQQLAVAETQPLLQRCVSPSSSLSVLRRSMPSPTSVIEATEDTDDLYSFEERRIRDELAKVRRAERYSNSPVSTSYRAPDPASTKAKRRLTALLEDEARDAALQPRVSMRRRRYGGPAGAAQDRSNTVGNGVEMGQSLHGAVRKGLRRTDDFNRWIEPVDVALEGRTETGEPFSEWDMNIPEQELHLYQLYCYFNRMIIVIRPVSSSVPFLSMGTFYLNASHCDALGEPLPHPELSLEQILEVTTHDCRVRGKSINVSLKSSTYPPIDGLIPVNPALGKAYLEAQRRERELEDLILNAQGGDRVVTISLLKKLKLQKAQAGSLTQAFRRDIEHALQRSNRECTELMERYKANLVLTVDKAAVSLAYIGQFNEAQFLGTTNATWRNYPVFYQELANGEVVRDSRDVPYFYIKKGMFFYQFHPEQMDINKAPEKDCSTMKAVLVVTHRMFFVSPTTQRIEEDPEIYLIGPDFDGLCYGSQESIDCTLNERIQWSEKINTLTLVRSMGLVNEFDVRHITEVRELTQWKQNHGYEATNVVKTQPLTPGPYVVITANLISMLKDVHQIIGFYRTAWKAKYPLVLNPNWRVAIDSDYLPRLYGDDLVLPIVDDCGYAALMSRIEAGEGGLSYEQLQTKYTPIPARLQAIEAERQKNRKVSGTAIPYRGSPDEDLDVFALFCRVHDRKHLSATFFEVRRWQLLPPWRSAFLSPDHDEASPEEIAAAELYVDPDFESYRAQQVKPRMEVFVQELKEFSELHGPSPFLELLLMYINPEPDRPSESPMASSIASSMADLIVP